MKSIILIDSSISTVKGILISLKEDESYQSFILCLHSNIPIDENYER